ncbi:MAG: amino acid permease, partial [Bdellovibrionota bacterium]
GSAMATLVALALITFFASVGVGGWEAIVFKPGVAEPSDSPLPLALARVVGESHVFYHLLIGIGLCGLLASFHGIILAAGRATFEFGRMGYAPKIFGHTLKERQTPGPALAANLVIGIIALLTGKTSEIITIAVFGALTLYVISTLALFRLRVKEPKLHRPFKTPGYPWVPRIALALSLICLLSMAYYNRAILMVYLAMLFLGYAWYFTLVPKEIRQGKRL